VFTGIVQEVGVVRSVEGNDEGVRIAIDAPRTAAAAGLGDSISIAGVCLTVTANVGGALAFDAVPETLSRSSLGRLAAGDRVNVEPAVRASDRLDGHIVQGHVDGTGRVRALEPEGDGSRLTVELPPELLRDCVEKGSIALEGVSLTVAALDDESIDIALVPHTLAATTLGGLTPGDPVNVEVDVLAKYVERLLESRIET
jgi:riboflavin synthase